MNNTTTGTITRTIILVIALINQGLTISGHSMLPISDEQVQESVSLLFTIVMSLITWWKNNSFTKHAQLGDKVMKEYKASGYVPAEFKEEDES